MVYVPERRSVASGGTVKQTSVNLRLVSSTSPFEEQLDTKIVRTLGTARIGTALTVVSIVDIVQVMPSSIDFSVKELLQVDNLSMDAISIVRTVFTPVLSLDRFDKTGGSQRMELEVAKKIAKRAVLATV